MTLSVLMIVQQRIMLVPDTQDDDPLVRGSSKDRGGNFAKTTPNWKGIKMRCR